jgi:hypothetical protein
MDNTVVLSGNFTLNGPGLLTCSYQGNALFNSSTPSGGVINVQ